MIFIIIHTVRPGDTLYRLAKEFGLSVDDIADANGIRNMNALSVGQNLIIPVGNQIHTVKAGQSLYTIARSHNISLDELLGANPNLSPPYLIYPGQRINIPIDAKKLGTIEVNGFLYPSITNENLRKTLPHLTYVSIFSCNITEDGGIVPPSGDERIINAAISANAAPLLVLTNLQEGAGFSSDIIAGFLGNEAVWDDLINSLIELMRRKGYFGLNIDFEYIPRQYREAYNQFLRRVKSRLSPLSFKLFTCLAPKISDTQVGTLYEAHDYAVHGEIADRVIIMTYEWGYILGPPMAVSPYDQIRRVLDYSVSRIPPDKLLMSMPGYGYDWTLPYTRGTRAVNLSIEQASDLANRVGAEIQFDVDSMTPFFEYTDQNGRMHIVWFDDAKSAEAKLRLIYEYGLAGVSYWTINVFWTQNWATLDSLFNVKKVI